MQDSRLVTLWCSKCGKITPQRIYPDRAPICLSCEDKPGAINLRSVLELELYAEKSPKYPG